MNATSLDHTSWEGANSRRTLVSIPASEDGRVVPIASSLSFLKGIPSLLTSQSRGVETSSLYLSPIFIFRRPPRCLRYLEVVVVHVPGCGSICVAVAVALGAVGGCGRWLGSKNEWGHGLVPVRCCCR